jgi:hypothetical protein
MDERLLRLRSHSSVYKQAIPCLGWMDIHL